MAELITLDPVQQIFGLIYLAFGASFICAPKAWVKLLEANKNNTAIYLLFGTLCLLVGLFLTVFYQSWETIGRGLLTIIGYLALLEAVLFLFFPGQISKAFTDKDANLQIIGLPTGICAIALGFALLLL